MARNGKTDGPKESPIAYINLGRDMVAPPSGVADAKGDPPDRRERQRKPACARGCRALRPSSRFCRRRSRRSDHALDHRLRRHHARQSDRPLAGGSRGIHRTALPGAHARPARGDGALPQPAARRLCPARDGGGRGLRVDHGRMLGAVGRRRRVTTGRRCARGSPRRARASSQNTKPPPASGPRNCRSMLPKLFERSKAVAR